MPWGLLSCVCWSPVRASGCSDLAAGCTAGHLSVLCLGTLWRQPWQSAWAGGWPGHCCAPVLPYWMGWNSGANLSRRDSDSWKSPLCSREPPAAHGGSHVRAGGYPKAQVIPSKAFSGAGSWHDLWTHGRAPLWSSS